MTRLAIVVALFACSSTKTPSGPVVVEGDDPCAIVKPRVEQLYRAEAQAKEPKRVDEAVADNTTMVMNDCARAPQQVASCVQASATVADLEANCLERLDAAGNVIR